MSELSEACNEHCISIQSIYCGITTTKEGWKRYTWACSLSIRIPEKPASSVMEGYKYLRVPKFTCGMGHAEKPMDGKWGPLPPEPVDVLHCMLSDSDVLNYDGPKAFQDWVSSYGYSEDSRKCYKIWKKCHKQTKKLIAFLGDELFQKLRNLEH